MNPDITTTAAYKAAEVYERFFVPGIFRYWTPLLLQRAAPQAGERVLDVACGTGIVARSIAPLVGPQGKVIGLDINPAMLAVACRQFAENCDDIEWREGRAEDLPFASGDFDLVTCQQGLQFFKDRPQAAREMRRVLRPGGRVAIEVWQTLENNPFYGKVFEAMVSVFDVPMASIASPYAFGDPDQLERLLLDAGLRQVSVERVSQDCHFEEPGRFVELTIKAAAAVIPAFADMDGDSQSGLQAQVAERVSGHLRAHTTNGILTFPMRGHIATGYC